MNKKSTIEAILFASGAPVSAEKIAEATDFEIGEIMALINELSNEYDARNAGICILSIGDAYQLSTRSEYFENVGKALNMRRNAPLSPAAFEVLAIIAYNQPVTKAYIEQVRGVDCGGVVNGLCEKGLIEEAGRLDIPGKPLVYRTTVNFLRCFQINSLEELPKLEESEN